MNSLVYFIQYLNPTRTASQFNVRETSFCVMKYRRITISNDQASMFRMILKERHSEQMIMALGMPI